MSSLTLNGHYYSQEELRAGTFQPINSFEASTLSFCHQWLHGKEQFEIQTSGSTGASKKITLSRKQMETSAQITARALSLHKNYTSLICLDTQYVAGQMMIVRSLVTGMNMMAVTPSANPLIRLPENNKIDFVALVPYQLQAILSSSHSTQLNEMRCAIIGGAALAESVIRALQNYSCSFFATYGMTETISHIALRKLNGIGKQNYFHPLEHIHLKQDERGCLVINAAHVSDQDIITNDVVDLKNDQSFYVLGRWDNVINTGGVKIAAEVLEEKIGTIFNQLHLKNRFFIAGLPDEALGNKVTLIIEGEPFSAFTSEQLLDDLRKVLSRFEMPKMIRFTSAFAETATQKINRKKTIALLP